MNIDKEELKEILKEQREEFQRYIKILKEDWDSKFKIIGEWQKFNQPKLNKIDSIEERIGRMEDDIRIIKTSLKRKVDYEEFETLEKRVVVLENKLKNI